jgi:hypothetical protein
MTAAVVIAGTVVLSVVITVCTLIALVSNTDQRSNISICSSYVTPGLLSLANYSRSTASETLTREETVDEWIRFR